MKKLLPFSLLALICIGCVTDEPAQVVENIPQEAVVEEPVSILTGWRLQLSDAQEKEDLEKMIQLLHTHGTELELSEKELYLSLLISYNRMDEAKILGEELLGVSPDRVKVLYLNSLIYDLEGDSEMTISLIDRAYKQDRRDPDVNLFKAELLLREKDYNGANRYLSVTLEQEPDNFSALVAKADVLMHLGEGNDDLNEKFLSDAVIVLDRVEEIAPDYVYTYVDRARALAVLGDTYRAMKDLDRAIELEPHVEWHYLDRVVLNLKHYGRLDLALEDIKSIEAINDNNLFAHIYGAGVYDDLKDYETALQYYEKVLTARPDYGHAYEGAGKIYFMMENYEMAEKCFLKAYELIYPYEGYILMSALSMRYNGKKQVADEILKEGIKSLDQDGIMYEIFRYYIYGGSDFFIMNEIPTEENIQLRNIAYYYLGEMYRQQNSSSLTATASFSNLGDDDGYYEADIANWHRRGADTE